MPRKTWLVFVMVAMLLLTLVLVACGNSGSEDIKAVVNSYYDAWNNRDFEGCLQLFSSSLGYTEYNLESMSEAREIIGEITITDLEEPAITEATATILIEVSPPDQQAESIEIPLAKEDGVWKLAGGGLSSRPAEDGDTVRVHYTGTLEDGTEFDSSRDRDPLEFTLGAGGMIPGFENAIYGMEKGETKTVTIPPEEAYGLPDEDLIMVINRDQLPEWVSLSIGSEIPVTLTNGNQTTAIITEITETTITLDANFFLVGKYLNFEITLVGVISPLAPNGALP